MLVLGVYLKQAYRADVPNWTDVYDRACGVLEDRTGFANFHYWINARPQPVNEEQDQEYLETHLVLFLHEAFGEDVPVWKRIVPALDLRWLSTKRILTYRLPWKKARVKIVWPISGDTARYPTRTPEPTKATTAVRRLALAVRRV